MSDQSAYADITFDLPLDEVDPFTADLTRREQSRQRDKLILIPSESLTPRPVREALASPFTSIYAEGYPARAMVRDEEDALRDLDWQLARFRRYSDRRYYRGNDYTNLIESLARRRCAELFGNARVSSAGLHVNVQPLSGAAANNAVYEALLQPDDTIMGLALAHGGHLSHGAKVNRSGIRYRSASYALADADAQLDYDAIAQAARKARPKIIVAGYTSYPWPPDWARFREIADSVDAYLMADISHPAGLVAAGAFPSPVGIADIVTFTTHKTLFGPRGAVILSHRPDLMRKIDRAVFPGEQGGPHLNKIAAMAVAFGLAARPESRATQHRIVANASALAAALQAEGVGLAYGGTGSHLLVINLRKCGARGDLRGEPAVRLLDFIGLVANRNSLPGDRGFAAPTGVRMGTPWLTQRGYDADDMRELAGIMARAFRAMASVSYPGRRTPRFRGRIDYGTLKRLSGEVLDFARRGRAEGVSTAPVEPARAALLEVRGPRADAFVDEISNRRTRDLAAGGAAHVGIGTSDGAADASALVFRPQDPGQGSERRCLIVVDPQDGPALAEWLQALSDGYVVADRGDLTRKLSGAVSVRAGTSAARPLDALSISASDAGALGAVAPGGSTQVELAGCAAWLIADGEAAAVIAPAREMAAIECALSQRRVAYTPLPPPPPPDLARPFFLGRGRQPADSGTHRKREFVWREPDDPPLRRTPLHSFHASQAKKLIPFAGWEMPVWYTSIRDEHRAVREAAGLFDVGHMGVLSVSGPHAAEFLDLVVTGSASRLPPGRALYTHLLDPTGHCLDDLIVYRLEAERFLAVVNAANAAKDWAWLSGVNEREYEIETNDHRAACPVKASLENLKDAGAGARQRLDLALQGPRSRAILERLVVGDERAALAAMQSNDVRSLTVAGAPVEAARTGYTGERMGFEIFVHPDAAPGVWDAILEAGADQGLVPAGLGARDSTRTEAGFPLYGHELAGPLDLTPCDAGFGNFVKAYKPFFIGRAGILRRETQRRAQIVRFAVTEERAPMARQGDPVTDVRGVRIGSVTSAALDITGRQIGMAHVDRRRSALRTPLQILAGASVRTGSRTVSPRSARVIRRFRA